MKKYIKYDLSGNILCYGMMSDEKYYSQKLSGIKVLEVNTLHRDMDVDYEIINIESENKEVKKKEK